MKRHTTLIQHLIVSAISAVLLLAALIGAYQCFS